MTSPRAIRYRRLALAEQDNEKAQLLRLIADEADRGVAFRHKGSRGTGHTIGFFAAESKPCAEHDV